MEARRVVGLFFLLLLLLLIPNTFQQSTSKKRNSKNSKKECVSSAALEELKQQISNITEELNLLKEQQALQTVCLRGTQIPGACLLADSTLRRSFHAAGEHCAARGGTLATPTSAHQNQQLLDYSRQSLGPAARLWLGFTDLVDEGHWLDQWGGAVHFANWETAVTLQPDGGRQQNCVVLDVAANGKWFDESCHQERATVCQYNMV